MSLLNLGLLLFLRRVYAHVGFPPGIGAWLLTGLRVNLGDEFLVLKVVGVEVHLTVYPLLPVENLEEVVQLSAGADGPASLVKECRLLFLGKVTLVGVVEES